MKPGDAFSVVLVSDSCAIHGVDINELIMGLIRCVALYYHDVHATKACYAFDMSTGGDYQRAVERN